MFKKVDDLNTFSSNNTVNQFLDYMAHQTYNDKIRYVVLFGSYARGEERLTSDVDIAIICDDPITHKERTAVYPDAERTDIDILDYRFTYISTDNLTTTEYLNVGYHIKNEGVLLYEREI